MTLRQAYKQAHAHCDHVHFVMIEESLTGSDPNKKPHKSSFRVCMMGESQLPHVSRTGTNLGIALTAAKAEWTKKMTAHLACQCPSCGESLK